MFFSADKDRKMLRRMKYTDQKTFTWSRQILQEVRLREHMDMLQSGNSCLVSDIEERVLNRNKEIITSKSLVYADLPKGVHYEEWT